MPTDPFSQPRRFGRYQLLRRLAVGGMAEVSLARMDGVAGFTKLVVIKEILPDVAGQERFVELFLDEGRLAAQLSHPNIAQTFELGQLDGRYFLAMEYVPGQSIDDVDKRARETGLKVPLSCALRVVLQACEALDYAHGATNAKGQPLNLVHRDVTPNNIMVTWHGSVRLVDFGIAQAATHVHKTEAGHTRGKLGFMSPEQMRAKKVDLRSDLYSLGAVLYLLTTGQRPFDHLHGKLLETFAAATAGDFPRPRELNPALPAELEEIILKAMALEPAGRFASAGELLERLTRLAAAQGLLALPRELAAYLAALFPERVRALERLEAPEVDGETLTAALEQLDAVTDPIAPAVGTRPLPQPTETPDTAVTPKLPVLPGDTAVTPQVARSSGPTDPLSTVAEVPTDPAATLPIASQVTPRVSVPPPARRARGGVAVAAAIAGVGLLGLVLGVFQLLGQADAPPPVRPAVVEAAPEPLPEPATPPADEPAAAAAPKPPPPRYAAATPTGFLKLDAYPWVEVRHRGRKLGVTPLRVELPAGTLELTLVNPDVGLNKKVTVMVKAGEETTRYLELAPK